MSKIKAKIHAFIDSNKDAPLLTFLIIGITPILFYCSNNYWAVNSFEHLIYFSFCLVGFVGVLCLVYFLFFQSRFGFPEYKKYFLFWMLLGLMVLFLTHTFFATNLRRLFLVVVLIGLGIMLPFKPRQYYKKMLMVLIFFSSLSFFRLIIYAYEDIKPDSWVEQPDNIEKVKFKTTPNVYMIQPDGYVSEQMMGSKPYNYKSTLYGWLENSDFKVYDNFRSNYPASLTSNASLFAMKQHKFADMLFPKIEIANGREIISKNNPVVSIFNNNGYKTHFIAEDEYFQQNKKQKVYDYFNIAKEDFPYITKGGSEVRDVYQDFKAVFNPEDATPKFFFIEKLLPHHVAFFNTDESIKAERQRYLKRIEEVNLWLKDIITYISDRDENAIIIILADHGGWVGLRSFNDLYSNNTPELVNSIFSNIAAIKWNGHLIASFDKELKTNVNLFRVLFAVLSENSKYLEHLEEDSSYNLRIKSIGPNEVIKAIDGIGNVEKF